MMMCPKGVMTAKVMLNNVSDVYSFNAIVCSRDENVDLVSGRFTIDAKSILGCFSLDLSKPVIVGLHTTDSDVFNAFCSQIDKFLIKE